MLSICYTRIKINFDFDYGSHNFIIRTLLWSVNQFNRISQLISTNFCDYQFFLSYNNNNNNHLTASFPGQPG